MENHGMNRPDQVQTTPGGEHVEGHEIMIGPATYVVQRVFQGQNTIHDLLVARLEREKLDDSPFDDKGQDEV